MILVRQRIVPVALGSAILLAGCLSLDTAEPPPPPPDPVAFRSVSVGDLHVCGLSASREAFCWGSNGLGQLGTGNTDQAFVPQTVVQGDIDFDQISAGGSVTCAVTTANDMYCWGSNANGQLGVGGLSAGTVTPNRVPGDHVFTSVTAGAAHVCGLTADSVALCWGLAESGRLGNGQSGIGISNPSPDSVLGDLRFVHLTAGAEHTCGLVEDGTAYCWGGGIFGQLGIGSRQNADEPTAVTGGLLFTAIDAGGAHTCGIDTNDAAYCWGDGTLGQLGAGPMGVEDSPILVSGGLIFQAISAGGAHTCGLVAPSEAHCWGRNDDGQLGDGTQTIRNTPTAVVGGIEFETIHAGSGIQTATCGFDFDRFIFCWSNGFFGQLGNGTTDGSLEPLRVLNQDEGVGGPGF